MMEESSVESLNVHQVEEDSSPPSDSVQGIVELLVKNGYLDAEIFGSSSSSIVQNDIATRLENDPTRAMGQEEVVDYVRELTEMGIASLKYEPIKLKHERSALLQKIENVAFNNYEAFIRTSTCASHIKEQLREMDGQLRGLSQELPRFVKKSDTCLQESQSLSKRWKEASLMLSKHSFLLEVLETPQLMDSAVRNGLYDDALKLHAHVERLCKRHASNIPLLSTIYKEVQDCKEIMTQQLLKELNSNIQLPAALKVVNYLRRMQIMSEAELRIKFLTAREEWLQSLIREIPATNPLFHINKVIETNRNNMFDIVTQYRAIFPDPEEVTHAPTMMSMFHEPGHMITDPLFSQAIQYNPSSILNSWINYKVKDFLQCLKSDLNKCIEADTSQRQFNHPIESIIEPCYYFGLSMSRIGADFRPALITIFNDVFLKKFKRMVMNATVRFDKSLQSFTPAPASAVQLSQPSEVSAVQSLKPPSSLASYPILVQLLNGLLTAMNDIRQLTPLSLALSFTQILNNALHQVSMAISQHYKAEESGYSERERQSFSHFCQLYVDELVPHISKCFERLLPASAIAKAFGLSVNEMNKLFSSWDEKNGSSEKSIPGKLNIPRIVEPISHLLPVKESITLVDDAPSEKQEPLPIDELLPPQDKETSQPGKEKSQEELPPSDKLQDPLLCSQIEPIPTNEPLEPQRVVEDEKTALDQSQLNDQPMMDVQLDSDHETSDVTAAPGASQGAPEIKAPDPESTLKEGQE